MSRCIRSVKRSRRRPAAGAVTHSQGARHGHPSNRLQQDGLQTVRSWAIGPMHAACGPGAASISTGASTVAAEQSFRIPAHMQQLRRMFAVNTFGLLGCHGFQQTASPTANYEWRTSSMLNSPRWRIPLMTKHIRKINSSCQQTAQTMQLLPPAPRKSNEL